MRVDRSYQWLPQSYQFLETFLPKHSQHPMEFTNWATKPYPNHNTYLSSITMQWMDHCGCMTCFTTFPWVIGCMYVTYTRLHACRGRGQVHASNEYLISLVLFLQGIIFSGCPKCERSINDFKGDQSIISRASSNRSQKGSWSWPICRRDATITSYRPDKVCWSPFKLCAANYTLRIMGDDRH